MKEVAQNEIEARSWFIENFKSLKYEKKLLKDMICKSTGIPNKDITDANILTLLKERNSEISLDGGKKKISLDSECVFYLA